MFSVGMPVTIEMNLDGKVQKLTTKIIEFNKKHLFFSYPAHQSTGRTEYLNKGQKIKMSLVGDNNIVYEFNTTILGKKRIKKIPVLFIERPKSEDVKKIQRRNYVRLDTTLDVAIYSTDEEKEPLITRSYDISGGGLAVAADKHNNFKPDESIHITIVLPFKSNNFEYIETPGKVIRYFYGKEESIPKLSIKFTDISEEAREKIIKFIFEAQLEARRKLLSSGSDRRKLT